MMRGALQEFLRASYQMIYGTQKADELFEKLEQVLHKYEETKARTEWLTEKDVMLITFGDSLTEEWQYFVDHIYLAELRKRGYLLAIGSSSG